MSPMRIRRGGVVLICVLACLVVVTSLLVTSMSAASRARRQAKVYQELVQVGWLMDAGIQRALQRVHADPEYTGEQVEWTKPLQIHGKSAKLVIRVFGEETQKRRVQVVASLEPDDATASQTAARDRIQRSCEIQVDLDHINSGE